MNRWLVAVFAVAMIGCEIPTGSTITDHQDASRTAWVSTETTLTPANVTGLHKLGRYNTTGTVMAQPLYIPSFTVAGGSRNVIFSCDMANHVYLFDADSPGAAPLATNSFGPPRSVYLLNQGGGLYGLPIGCLSTPVIDLANSRAFIVHSTDVPTWVMRSLDLATLTDLVPAVTLTATAPGTGDPTTQTGIPDTVSNGIVTFNPPMQMQRTPLALYNGRVYVCFGSYGDIHPTHGWAMARNVSDLSSAGSMCMSPYGSLASVWQTKGVAIDSQGNVILSTGNGDWDGNRNWAMSVLKLTPSLSLIDSFTPSNWKALSDVDADLGNTGSILLESQNQIVISSKSETFFAIPYNCMGGLGGTQRGCPGVQEVTINARSPLDPRGSYGSAFFNNLGLFSDADPDGTANLYASILSGGVWSPVSATAQAWAWPGPASISVSSNGTNNGIEWVTVPISSNAEEAAAAGMLLAIDPSSRAVLWSSNALPANALGTLSKFSAPTIANGKVYVSTALGIVVYGL
jgi:hypothetical protein